jgi:hypothetical protein
MNNQQHIALNGQRFHEPFSINFIGIGIRTVNLDGVPGTLKKIHRSSYGADLKVGQVIAKQEVAVEEIREIPHSLQLLPNAPSVGHSFNVIKSREVLGGIKDGSLQVNDSQGCRILPQHITKV